MKAHDRLWTPTFVIILLLTLSAFVVGQGLNSGTSVFLSRTGGSATLAGFLALDFSVAAAVSRIVCGPVIDDKGRALVMTAGGAVMLAGTLAPLAASDDAFLVAWRFLQGVGFAAVTTASATAAADVLPFARLGEGIGYYGLGQAVAMSIGPALALFLVSTDPASNLYLGLSVAALCALVLSVACRYERSPEILPASSAYRTRAQQGGESGADAGADAPHARSGIFELRALPGAIPMTIMCPAFGFGIFFVGLFGTELGLGSPGLFYTISALSMIAVRLKSKSFMDTVAAIKVLSAAVLSGIVCFSMLLAVGCGGQLGPAREVLYCVAGLFYGVTLGLALPVNQSVAVKNTPPERWGACNALFLLANDIGIGAAALLWGAVNDAFGFSASIVGVLVCIVLSYGAAWACYPAEQKRWK